MVQFSHQPIAARCPGQELSEAHFLSEMNRVGTTSHQGGNVGPASGDTDSYKWLVWNILSWLALRVRLLTFAVRWNLSNTEILFSHLTCFITFVTHADMFSSISYAQCFVLLTTREQNIELKPEKG